MKRITTILLFLVLTCPAALLASEVNVMDKDELKAMLDSPGLVLFDVRTGRDWSSSEFKIKGAVRLDEGGIDSAIKSYAKDKTIVLYCA